MIADLDDSTQTELSDYDLCVVGSGPAGMTVANELSESGLRICVLESGRQKPTRLGDRLRRVESEGIHIKDYSRERVLGGASTTWAGLSSPLDPIDMEPRPYVRHSGWPIGRDELLPYYERAAEGYRFPPLAAFEAEGFGALKRKGDIQPSWDTIDEKVFMAASEPQDFGREWRDAFETPGVDLWLDATVLRLVGEAETRRIRACVARTRGGREVEIRAREFVVATGGIENARLLLKSRDLCPAGLGNERDQVGRYLMNHPKNYHGILTLERPVEDLPYYFGCLYKGFAGYAGLRLNEEAQNERELLNAYVRLEPLFPWSDNDGIESLVLLVKKSRALFSFWKKKHEDEIVDLRDYSETGDDSDLQNERRSALGWVGLALNVVVNSPRVTQYLYFRLSKAKPKIREVRVRNFMEMEPDPENRVLLSDEKDEYGEPLPLVRHACTTRDKDSLLALHAALVEELPKADVGRFTTELAASDPWPIDQDASHHMGTTRMGTDVERSVVDTDCRVHGVENVWMAGASVFPTSGCANPTFTLVALSIRLAEHLREVLARKDVS